mmetsp:Transcript_28231/g.86255  ORF Transcript_28231/g.86255 Transcript_28231/m.86255 type:complete len:252 (+) Transcript_28231:1465-2220(+)
MRQCRLRVKAQMAEARRRSARCEVQPALSLHVEMDPFRLPASGAEPAPIVLAVHHLGDWPFRVPKAGAQRRTRLPSHALQESPAAVIFKTIARAAGLVPRSLKLLDQPPLLRTQIFALCAHRARPRVLRPARIRVHSLILGATTMEVVICGACTPRMPCRMSLIDRSSPLLLDSWAPPLDHLDLPEWYVHHVSPPFEADREATRARIHCEHLRPPDRRAPLREACAHHLAGLRQVFVVPLARGRRERSVGR